MCKEHKPGESPTLSVMMPRKLLGGAKGMVSSFSLIRASATLAKIAYRWVSL